MKKWLKYKVFFLLLAGIRIGCFAQDVGFSQFYSNPLYLNPAFSGTLGVPRINMQYRDQWQSFPNAFTTQSVSFDSPAEKLHGALGFHLLKDAQADNLLKTIQASLIYSTFVRLTYDLYLSGALQAGYHHNSIDWQGLVFADNLDPYFGRHTVTLEAPLSDARRGYFDFSTGVLVFGDKLFSGLAIHHLAQPSVSWYNGQDDAYRLKRKYSLHFGTRIPVHIHGHHRKLFDLMPQVVLMRQGKFNQYNYGMLADWKGLTCGFWFRQDKTFNYDALIFLVGYMKHRWHFTYSYDWTVSGLAGHSGGTSEISLGFLLGSITRHTPFPFYSPYMDELGK